MNGIPFILEDWTHINGGLPNANCLEERNKNSAMNCTMHTSLAYQRILHAYLYTASDSQQSTLILQRRILSELLESVRAAVDLSLIIYLSLIHI